MQLQGSYRVGDLIHCCRKNTVEWLEFPSLLATKESQWLCYAYSSICGRLIPNGSLTTCYKWSVFGLLATKEAVCYIRLCFS